MQRNNRDQACASCKHQRKKCTENCVLAPFFPSNKSHEFKAVHRVFGVSNITKMVQSLNDNEDQKKAIDSFVWEAFCREKDPILGPYGEYKRLFEELRLYKMRLQQIQAQIQGGMVYKSTPSLVGWNNNNNNNNGTCNKGMPMSVNSMLDSNNYKYSSLDHHQIHNSDNNVLVLPQQHSINGFNHQYYYPGQYNTIDAKTMESTLWEGGS